MENNKQTLTIALVLIIGLLGGYMAAEHAGPAKHSHEPADEEAGHSPMADQVQDMADDAH